MEERFTEIERENRILMVKLASIIKRDHNNCKSIFYCHLTCDVASRKSLTNRSNSLRNHSPSNSFSNDKPYFYQKSLNYGKRVREYNHILAENEVLLQRLQRKNSTFDVTKWDKDDKERQKKMKNLNCYRRIEEKMHLANMEKTLQSSLEKQFSRVHLSSTISGGPKKECSKSIIKATQSTFFKAFDKSALTTLNTARSRTSQQKEDSIMKSHRSKSNKLKHIKVDKSKSAYKLQKLVTASIENSSRGRNQTVEPKHKTSYRYSHKPKRLAEEEFVNTIRSFNKTPSLIKKSKNHAVTAEGTSRQNPLADHLNH